MAVEKRFLAKTIFTGHEWLSDQEVILINNTLTSIGPAQEDYPVVDLLIPSFIDLQVYGAAGHLFSAFPSPHTLELMYQAFSKEGTHFFLPTIATNNSNTIESGIKAVRTYWENGGKGCLGLHLEGPWINPEKRGAHDAQFIKVPTEKDVEDLLLHGSDVIKMITLAPEFCAPEILKMLIDANILLSAGHSMATFEQGMQSFSNGVSLATHLFNAMPPFQHRAPGLVGAIFSHNNAMASIIPDGYHVDWAVIKLSYQLMGDRLFAITDAVTTCNKGPYQHTLQHDHYTANGVLSGSALTMLRAFNNLIFKAGFTVQEAAALCVANPARAFQSHAQLGNCAMLSGMPCVPLVKGEQGYEIFN